MPVTVEELQTSRKLVVDEKSPKDGIELVAWGSADEAEVYAAVAAYCPAVYLGMTLRSIALNPQGGGVWLPTAQYESPDGPPAPGANLGGGGGGGEAPAEPAGDEPLDAGVSVTIGETTQHITQSRLTRHKVGVGDAVAPDYKRAIGVTKDKVEGADVSVGTLQVSITRELPFVTLDYIRTLRLLVGRSNSVPFWGFDAHAVKYRGGTLTPKQGANAKPGGVVKYTGVFNFDVGENRTSVEILPESSPGAGDGLVVPSVRAWEYLWCAYKTSSSGGRTVEVPFAAYVEEVVGEADYSLIGLTG